MNVKCIFFTSAWLASSLTKHYFFDMQYFQMAQVTLELLTLHLEMGSCLLKYIANVHLVNLRDKLPI